MNPPHEEPEPMLVAENLTAGYGRRIVVRDVCLSVPRATITAVLGRNGAGKTTLVSAVMGLLPSSGWLTLSGRDVARLPAWRRARAGMQLVRQGRFIFPSLTLRENLEVVPGGVEVDALLELFPNLLRRADVFAGHLSGGEQQMLALARAMKAEPGVLMLDEPTEGLAPQVVDALGDQLRALRDRGCALMLVEQSLPLALELADTVHLMDGGRFVFGGSAEELGQRRDLQQAHLGV